MIKNKVVFCLVVFLGFFMVSEAFARPISFPARDISSETVALNQLNKYQNTHIDILSNIDLDNNSIFGADTIAVNTAYEFPDGTTQNTSPQACASGEALNSSGCESFSTSSGSSGFTETFQLNQVPPNDDVEKLYKVPAGDTYTVTRAGVTDNNFSNSDNFQLAIRDQYGNLQNAYTTKEDTTTVDVNGDWIVFSLENNTSDTVEITGYAEVQK